MKAVLVALCLLAAVAVLAPAAEAKPYCSAADSHCPGDVCAWDPVQQRWSPCVYLECLYVGSCELLP